MVETEKAKNALASLSLEYANESLRSKERADAQIKAAEQLRGELEAASRAAASRAAAESSRLRQQIASDREVLAATRESLAKYAVALGTVFRDCTARYGALAETADGHIIDIATLKAAWPRE